MPLHSARSNALCLAVALALAAAPVAADPYRDVYHDVDLEEVPWGTRRHIEIYDSRVNSTKDADHGTETALTASQSSLIMERTQVATRGKGMGGVSVYGPGDSALLDSSVVTHGENATGIDASARLYLQSGGVAPSGAVVINRTSIETFGQRSLGVTHALGGIMTLRNSQIATHGDASHALNTHAGPVEVFGSEILTTGAGSDGVSGRSFWLVGLSGERIAFNARVGMTDVAVETRGTGSVGLLAYYLGSVHETIGTNFNLRGSSVRSAQSHAVKFDGGDANVLSLSEGSVLDGGDAVLYSGRTGTISRVDATDSTLIGRGEQAVVADNGAIIHLGLDNSDFVLEAGKGLAWASNGGRIDLQAKGSRLQGSAFADDASRLDVALDGSRWDAWGKSQVDALSLRNGSTLLLGAGSVGDQLIVRGDFDIEDSTLVFDSTLGDDRSPTDYLWVQGNTRGQGNIAVNNAGGRGAQTNDGIRLIAVDGESNAAFTLQGRAVGGVYEYFLHKGTKSDPADGGWYLRSELNEEPDPCGEEGACDRPPPRPVPCGVDGGQTHCEPGVVEPPPRPLPCSVDAGQPHCEPEVIVPPPAPVLRPETGAYLANQSAAAGMFGTRRQDRSGSDHGVSGRGAWARVARHQADYGVIGDQLRVSGGTDVLQIGTDLFSWGEESRSQLGVMLGSGRANSTVTSRLTGYSTRGKVEGQALGVYATWVQDPSVSTGLYMDASANHASFKNSVQGDALGRERYNSKATSVSIEAGYGLRIINGERVAMFVEPQAQLGYTRFSAERHVESNGTVIDGSDDGGLSSRVGVHVFGHASTTPGVRVQPFLAVNWIRESSDNGLRFDGERLAGGVPRDRYELSGGAEVQLSQRWSARGDLGWQRGGGYREVTGQLAMRASW